MAEDGHMPTSEGAVPPGSQWYDAEAGPLVRRYTVTVIDGLRAL